MDYYPAFMDIAGRRAIVGGGGAVAARKADMLVRAGALVDVVAPVLCAELDHAVATGLIGHRADAFAPEHLDGAVLAIAATDDEAVNHRVARHARLSGLPINVVDDAAQSSFITPAVIDRSPVVVTVSTGGASLVLARWIRTRIETALPAALGRLAGLAGRYRRAVKRSIPDAVRRRFMCAAARLRPTLLRARRGWLGGRRLVALLEVGQHFLGHGLDVGAGHVGR